MIEVQNHKGQKCIYEKMLCQEGYCSECAVCLKRISAILTNNLEKEIVSHSHQIKELVSSKD
jgi:hypothetical protein